MAPTSLAQVAWRFASLPVRWGSGFGGCSVVLMVIRGHVGDTCWPADSGGLQSTGTVRNVSGPPVRSAGKGARMRYIAMEA